MTDDERFADFDARLALMQDRTARFRDATADAIHAMEERLAVIDHQNQRLAEMVQVLGGYVNTGIEMMQDHTRDGHGADPS